MKPKQHFKRHIWTKSERRIMCKMFADNYTETICKILNRSYRSVCSQATLMGLKKSEAFMKMELQKQAERLKIVGVVFRYKKGRTPENKGEKMPDDVYEKVKHTMFKKGQLPHNSYNDWDEVLRTDKTGKQYWMIKLPNERKLKPKHIWIWETKNGKVEKGFNVVFKDGNQLNCIIENLECISNAELMQRNTIHRFPTELKSTIRLVKKLKRTINAKEQN
ncbi:MAG: HNH endonuclease [Verrucomicrobia bacterium]|nr:HNH endonuclease [Verrucomicrobiota bacterium]